VIVEIVIKMIGPLAALLLLLALPFPALVDGMSNAVAMRALGRLLAAFAPAVGLIVPCLAALVEFFIEFSLQIFKLASLIVHLG